MVSCSWLSAIEVENTKSSGLAAFVNDVIPLKPLVQSTKVTSVLLVYVIISSLIFTSP